MDEKVLYKISVYTSNFDTAGTNYNAWLQIFGTKRNESAHHHRDKKSLTTSIKFPLEKSKTNQRKFRPGQKDKFEIEETPLDKITKIRLALVDNPLKTNWHIKKVEIKANGKKWVFMHRNWLAYSEETREMECYIKPIKDAEEAHTKSDEEKDAERDGRGRRSEKLNKIRYDVKILTNECSKLLDLVNINLKIVGKGGLETGVVKLNANPSDDDKEKFQSGNTDIFYLEETDVGMIDLIKVYCDYNERGKMVDWFFDEITINIPSKLLRYKFTEKSRTVIIKEKDHYVTEIYPISEERLSDKKFYCINVYANSMTPNRKLELDRMMNSMTLSVHGDFDVLANKKPVACKLHGRPSLGSHRDDLSDHLIHFHVPSVDLGALWKLKLSYEHKDLRRAESWFLKFIQIYYGNEKQEFYFPCKKWIKVDKEQRKVELTLKETNASKTRTLSVLSHRLLKEVMKSGKEDRDVDSQVDSHSERSYSSKSEGNSPRRHHRPHSEERDDYDRQQFSPTRRANSSTSNHKYDELKEHSPRKFKLDIGGGGGSPRGKSYDDFNNDDDDDIYSSLESLSDGPLSPAARSPSRFKSGKYNELEEKKQLQSSKNSFIFTKQEKEPPKRTSKFDEFDDDTLLEDEFSGGRSGRNNFDWNSKSKTRGEFDVDPPSDRFYKKDPFKKGTPARKTLAFVDEEDEIEDELAVKPPARYDIGKFDYKPKLKF